MADATGSVDVMGLGPGDSLEAIADADPARATPDDGVMAAPGGSFRSQAIAIVKAAMTSDREMGETIRKADRGGVRR